MNICAASRPGRGVEEVAPIVQSLSDGLNAVFLAGDLPVAVGEAHAAHADLADG